MLPLIGFVFVVVPFNGHPLHDQTVIRFVFNVKKDFGLSLIVFNMGKNKTTEFHGVQHGGHGGKAKEKSLTEAQESVEKPHSCPKEQVL